MIATDPSRPDASLRLVAWSAVAATYALIVLGGVVRITGSGLGCGDDWPLCNGRLVPPLDLPTLIEYGHRVAAALVSGLAVAVAAVAWLRHRREPRLLRPAVVALALLVLQVLLGAVTVKLELAAWSVILHLGNAMLLLGAFLLAAIRASTDRGGPPDHPAGGRTPLRRLAWVAAAFGLAVVLLGALVANLHAGPACQGFPLCNGSWLPSPASAPPVVVHWAHRTAAFAFVAFSLVVALRARRGGAAVAAAAWAAFGLAAAQLAVAAAMVLRYLPSGLRALHLAIGTGIWAALVVLAHLAGRPSLPPSPSPRRQLVSDLVALTKPRIISLLLVTTVLPMFVAGERLPSAALVLWTAVGGYLMAGGANTINMWFDRDIDTVMGRTSLRPIPSGRIRPGWALAYGIALAAAAFAVLYLLVNPLAAWLALAGLLYYVFVYTVWLKRSTPLNIVLGGAAGSFPPLVGWAAATGTIDLAAVYLFAIVFYWTPPHFWALALIKQADYARAGVPMLPVVRGERETKWQILLYAVMLVPLTLAPSAFGAFGALYAAAALVLGLRLVWYCVALLRAESLQPTAWRLYRFSLLYLALLFLAMALDRAVPIGRVDAARGASARPVELAGTPAR
jgi:protoheme IX farnesyltransferase